MEGEYNFRTVEIKGTLGTVMIGGGITLPGQTSKIFSRIMLKTLTTVLIIISKNKLALEEEGHVVIKSSP